MKAFLMKHSEALIISTFAIFAPIRGMIAVTVILVVCDFITGVIAAYKKGGIKNVKSYKMGTTISRFIIYLTAICLSFLVQVYMMGNEFPIVNWVAGVISVKELYSVFENLNKISGNNLFVEILNKLSSINYKKDEVKGSEEPPV